MKDVTMTYAEIGHNSKNAVDNEIYPTHSFIDKDSFYMKLEIAWQITKYAPLIIVCVPVMIYLMITNPGVFLDPRYSDPALIAAMAKDQEDKERKKHARRLRKNS